MIENCKVQPLSNRILLEIVNPSTTKAGIIIPHTNNNETLMGKVLALGEREDGKPFQMAVGDIILFNKFSGTALQVEGRDYLIMRDTDAQAILTGVDPTVLNLAKADYVN
jgi:chaperonin GroES